MLVSRCSKMYSREGRCGIESTPGFKPADYARASIGIRLGSARFIFNLTASVGEFSFPPRDIDELLFAFKVRSFDPPQRGH